jgi:hypothetical protein
MDKYADVINLSLNEVRKYITDKGLILTGGMVIDLALKMAGFDGIYGKDNVPDYDCITPNFYSHACELGEIICKKTNENPRGIGAKQTEETDNKDAVSVIPAMHVTTLRCRIHFTPVADLTYVPKELFDEIPFLVVPQGFPEEGMKIISPHYQILDIFHSLAYPMENFPRSVIFNRLKKDVVRFERLVEAYPFNFDELEMLDNPRGIHDISDVENAAKSCGVEEYVLYGNTAYEYLTGKKFSKPFMILSDSFENVIDGSVYINRTLDTIPEAKYVESSELVCFNNLYSRVCLDDSGKSVSLNCVLGYLCFRFNINKFNIKFNSIIKAEIRNYKLLFLDLIKHIQKNKINILPDLNKLYGKLNQTEAYHFLHNDLLNYVNTGKHLNLRPKSFYPNDKCETTHHIKDAQISEYYKDDYIGQMTLEEYKTLLNHHAYNRFI